MASSIICCLQWYLQSSANGHAQLGSMWKYQFLCIPSNYNTMRWSLIFCSILSRIHMRSATNIHGIRVLCSSLHCIYCTFAVCLIVLEEADISQCCFHSFCSLMMLCVLSSNLNPASLFYLRLYYYFSFANFCVASQAFQFIYSEPEPYLLTEFWI